VVAISGEFSFNIEKKIKIELIEMTYIQIANTADQNNRIAEKTSLLTLHL
jgi:hypothetical protein